MLTTCPDCKSEISDAAPACPKCGRPLASVAAAKKASNGRLVGGLALIALGAIGYFAINDLYITMGAVIAGVAGLVMLFIPSKR